MENTALNHSTSGQKENAGNATPYIVIYSDWPRRKLENHIVSLPHTVKHVHIDGLPYLWIVDRLVAALHGLEVLRVTPTAGRLFGTRHRRLLETRDIRLELGYHRPEHAWEEHELRNRKNYEEKVCKLRNLSSRQRGLFQELLTLEGMDDAHIASRYLCLNGEPYIPLHEVGMIFGYSPSCAASVVSFKVCSVIKFLYDDAEMVPEMREYVRILRKKIQTAREAKKKEEDERALFESFGIQSLPDKLPPSETVMYCILHQLFWKGELHACLKKFKRGLRVLELRYGLKGGSFRSYESIGQEFGRTGESARQSATRALRLLGLRECRL